MSEISNTTGQLPSRLDGLAMEARLLTAGVAMNMLQLGRVFSEAKPLVPAGEWQNWIRDNACVSVRTAEQYMQAYSAFGTNPDIANLGQSKVLKLLPMPEAEREMFLETHDVQNMTVREVDTAIKEAREQAQAEISRERELRLAAEHKAAELASRPPEVPESLTASLREKDEVIDRQWTELERLKVIGQEQLAEANKLRRENADLLRDVKDQADMLQEAQENYDQVQRELLDAKSAIARGEVDRATSDRLTSDVFARAVRQFMGDVARMPHMRTAFAMMGAEEKAEFDELLSTVESWAVDARKALDTTAGEGVIL